MKTLYTYIIKHRQYLILALVLAAINQCFSLSDSIITGTLIKRFGSVQPAGTVGHVWHDYDTLSTFMYHLGVFSLLSIGAAMMSRIAKNFQDYFTNIIIQRVGAEMYTDGIRKALQLPYKDFEDQRSGETLGRLQKVRIDTEKFVTLFISMVFQSLVGIIFVFAYAMHIHPLLGPMYLATVPVIAFVSSFLGKKIKIISKQIAGETTALAGATTESLRNIELVKSLGLVNQEEQRLKDNTLKILGLELKKIRFVRSLSFIQGTTVHFVRTLLIFTLYTFVFRDIIEIGDLITLLFFSFFIFNPLQELGNVIAVYNETKVSMDNFASLMNSTSEPEPTSPFPLGEINEIDFKQVSFGHNPDNGFAVESIDLHIVRGETIAFVGPSGSGKTTLVKLLLGLYQPNKGDVLYNGIPSSNIQLAELRKQLGLVSQDPQLFSGTIRDNLRFVKPEATDAEIYEVMNKAACQHLLTRAASGLGTTIGEGGMKLSGGEKQRLSIARALLRNPRLLIFDEATSALDSLTEEEITTTIKELSKSQEQITLLIAHRLSTIMHADRIVVLEKGRIIESGKHDELLTHKGLYFAMWRQQIGERKKS